MKTFMERTIAAHCLQCLPLDMAAHFVPSREPSYFDAKEYAENTNYFERDNILVADDNYFYPPLKSFVKSFKKWLAIQKHDVNAVNSLYEWRQAINKRLCELSDEIYELEELRKKITPAALQMRCDEALKRKDEEADALHRLESDLGMSIDKIRREKAKAVKAA